jgi:hypothetical protein
MESTKLKVLAMIDEASERKEKLQWKPSVD